MIVAVVGNPNSGKTTLYNALTGSRAHVGNYPGVTVERRQASLMLPGGRQVQLVDLPGCYSLIARSPEEEVAHQALLGAHNCPAPDLVVCVVDATQLARSLYLVLQIAELEIPMLVALNMMDLAHAQGITINTRLLAERLGMRVIPISARMEDGLDNLGAAIEEHLHTPRGQDASARIDTADATAGSAKAHGSALLAQLPAADVQCISQLRAALHTHSSREPAQKARSTPFASLGAALWLLTSRWDNIYASEVIVRGDAHDVLLQTLRNEGTSSQSTRTSFARRVISARYHHVDTLLQGVMDTAAQYTDRRTRAIDRILLHPVWGMAIFVLTMFVLFQAVFAWAEPLMGGIETGVGMLATWMEGIIPWPLTRSLVVHGLIAGVGNVLVFVPQIALLFLGLTLLEESGYMARAAFLMDRLMRRVGLHGTAFVPLLSSFACAIPGVMAARTIASKRDRLVTILIAPFMSCSARLPVYTLVIAAVFAATPPIWGIFSLGGIIVTAMYFLGFAAALATAWLLKRTVLRGPPPAFILEMPTYKRPPVKDVLRRVWERCHIFVTQTGVVIVCISMILWGLLTFPRLDPQYHFGPATNGTGLTTIKAELAAQASHKADAESDSASHTSPSVSEQQHDATQLEQSFGGRIGHAIEPLIAPLGFDWRIGVGLVASFAAREVLVSALGQVYALGSDVDPDSPALRDALLANADPATGRARFTPLTGISLMVFFVLAMQCMSTIAIVRRETNSWRWPIIQLIYMNGLAYAVSLLVYQGGRAMGLS